MAEPRRLMGILAHPDDETFALGGILAKYAAEGAESYLLTATRGERGWTGKPEDHPGMMQLGQIRETELRCAAKVLGVRELALLNYIDGDLDKALPDEVTASIAYHLRRVRPQVVVTFDPWGVTGHPDHIAIGQFTLGGIVAAASPDFESGLPPFAVSKLYYIAETKRMLDAFQEIMGQMRLQVDGETRSASGWPGWAVSAEIDTASTWNKVVEAMSCHRSQVADTSTYASIAKCFPREIWGIDTFFRAFSLVNSGRGVETDLFEGLPASASS